MAGLLTHLGIALIGGLIAGLIFNHWKYGVAFGFGHLIPDLIDFGIPGLLMGSANPAEIMSHPWFYPLMLLGHTWWHWVLFGILIFLTALLLYKLKKIKKNTFTCTVLILISFLIGVMIHLIIDILIIERSYWV